MNPSQLSLVSALIALFTLFAGADALVVVQPSRGTIRKPPVTISQNQLLKVHNTKAERVGTALRSTPEEDESADETIEEDDDNSEKSLFDKVNDFLDTPILDANNRSDQGALAETLKEFVRDEPEIAQVTFSAVVVAILVLLTRVVTSL